MINKNDLCYKKLVVSGNVAELYEYEQPTIKGYTRQRIGRANENMTDEKTKIENRKKTRIRARQSVSRLVNANASRMDKFITLTFKDNVTDIRQANKEFKKFIQRLNYNTKGRLMYIAVIEFQKRGAIHYHMLSNAPYIENEQLNALWGNGFVKINKIDNVDNLGAYVTKYMNKDLKDDRLQGKRCFLTSKNLKREKEIYNAEIIDELLPQFDINRVYHKSYDSEYNGKVIYTQFVLKSTIEKEINEVYERKYNIFRKIAQSFRTPFSKGVSAIEQLSFFE